jgi:hypothetical protein
MTARSNAISKKIARETAVAEIAGRSQEFARIFENALVGSHAA